MTLLPKMAASMARFAASPGSVLPLYHGLCESISRPFAPFAAKAR